ncbi:glycosyltransferase [bacterium]|nr:glycosyltransferase [bacterium]
MNPLVSIIIPVYNRRKLLPRAVDSVLNQSYKKFELIIIDDGSTDNPAEIAGKYNDSRIKFIRIPHGGVSTARNTGVSLAQYDYIAFLDSDDQWVKHKLEKQINSLSKNNSYHICYTGEQWIRNGKPFTHKKALKKFSGFVFDKCLSDCFIGCSTVLLRKNLFEQSGGFDPALTVCEDYDFWLKITAKYPVLLIEEPLIIKHGGHSDQLSIKFWGNDRFRVKSIYNLLNTAILNDVQRKQALRTFTQKCAVVAGGCLKRKKYAQFSVYLSLMINTNKQLEFFV